MSFTKLCTTLSNGCLGFRLDEERGKMRYVMRIAEFSESSTLRTQMAQRLVLGPAFWAQFVRGKHVLKHVTASAQRISDGSLWPCAFRLLPL